MSRVVIDVNEEGDPYLVRFEQLFLFQSRSLLALACDWWRERANLDNFQRFQPHENYFRTKRYLILGS